MMTMTVVMMMMMTVVVVMMMMKLCVDGCVLMVVCCIPVCLVRPVFSKVGCSLARRAVAVPDVPQPREAHAVVRGN